MKWGTRPLMAPSRVDLPTPVRPTTRASSPSSMREAHVAEDRDGGVGVGDGHVVELDHAGTSIRSGRDRHASVDGPGPRATTAAGRLAAVGPPDRRRGRHRGHGGDQRWREREPAAATASAADRPTGRGRRASKPIPATRTTAGTMPDAATTHSGAFHGIGPVLAAAHPPTPEGQAEHSRATAPSDRAGRPSGPGAEPSRSP